MVMFEFDAARAKAAMAMTVKRGRQITRDKLATAIGATCAARQPEKQSRA
jgi:hypothetical protein